MRRLTEQEKRAWDGFMYVVRAGTSGFPFPPAVLAVDAELERLRIVNAALLEACRAALGNLRRWRDEKPEQWDAIVDAEMCSAWDGLRAAIAQAEEAGG